MFSSCFLIVSENRVAIISPRLMDSFLKSSFFFVNRRTFPVERRKSASLTITGKASNANANQGTPGPHAVSLLVTYLVLFNLKTTLHSDNMADTN